MLMVKCEKCGKVFELKEKRCPSINFGQYDYYGWNELPNDSYDVCQDCYNELKSMFVHKDN